MLHSTFRHLPGIGRVREHELWRQGVLCWEDLERAESPQLTLFGNTDRLHDHLVECRSALESGDVDYFTARLPTQEHYRIALTFPSDIVFLDIETTGLSRYYDSLTVVGWAQGTKYGAWIKGQSEQRILDVLRRAKVLVTFNGKLFDVPFLRKFMAQISLPPCHLDLRFLCRQVGLKGGQKEIEKELGISRGESVRRLKSDSAPVLWHRYCWGETEALRLLIEYNFADVAGMMAILRSVLTRRLAELPPRIRAGRSVDFPSKLNRIRFGQQTGKREGIVIQQYRGKPGARLRITNLAQPANLRIVGIDPTGSENRPSGWCLLDGCHATTRRLLTTAEIIAATTEAKPQLVSIDSPLSLPVGRQWVGDDDPGRTSYGITRHCERVLKRRGVNVYPCLIPSMQSLTARGMTMAAELRKCGIPVIESYPGAAQDIMRIPRKGAGIEFLIRGLEAFGVRGSCVDEPTSHDELDAVTAAIVGVFFWAGRFEALGTEEEDYLIIPELHAGSRWDNRFVVGLSGPLAAGKTTAAKLFEEAGFEYARYSAILQEELLRKGINPSREQLQVLGEQIHEEGRQRWLGKQVLRRLSNVPRGVIDGLRHPEDHSYLVETFGPSFLHVSISAPNESRKQRYLRSGFSEAEYERAIQHPVENNVERVTELAHVTLTNGGDLEDLRKRTSKLTDSGRARVERTTQCQ